MLLLLLLCLRGLVVPGLEAASLPQRLAQPLQEKDLVWADSEAAILQLDMSAHRASVFLAGPPLVRPYGIAVAPDHTVYVTDTGALAVFAIAPATRAVRILASGNRLGVPFGLALDRQGRIYVANARQIVRLCPATGSQEELPPGAFQVAPLGVCVAVNSQLYVADALARILRIHPTSSAQTVVSAGDHFLTPMGVAVDDHQTVYVADPGVGAVLQVDPRSGRQDILWSGEPLAAPLGIARHRHLLFLGDPDAFDLKGGIFALDTRTGTVTPLFEGQGNYVNPRGVAVVPRLTK